MLFVILSRRSCILLHRSGNTYSCLSLLSKTTIEDLSRVKLRPDHRIPLENQCLRLLRKKKVPGRFAPNFETTSRAGLSVTDSLQVILAASWTRSYVQIPSNQNRVLSDHRNVKMPDKKQQNGHATRGRRVSEVVMQLDERIQKEENIFLFLPNLIGESVCKPGTHALADHMQVTRESSSRSYHSITCLYIPELVPCYTASRAYSMLWMVSPREDTISQPHLARC